MESPNNRSIGKQQSIYSLIIPMFGDILIYAENPIRFKRAHPGTFRGGDEFGVIWVIHINAQAKMRFQRWQ